MKMKNEIQIHETKLSDCSYVYDLIMVADESFVKLPSVAKSAHEAMLLAQQLRDTCRSISVEEFSIELK